MLTWLLALRLEMIVVWIVSQEVEGSAFAVYVCKMDGMTNEVSPGYRTQQI